MLEILSLGANPLSRYLDEVEHVLASPKQRTNSFEHNPFYHSSISMSRSVWSRCPSFFEFAQYANVDATKDSTAQMMVRKLAHEPHSHLIPGLTASDPGAAEALLCKQNPRDGEVIGHG